jgi:hypothetical protein
MNAISNISTSPLSSWSSALRSWLRSVLAPLAVSRNTFLHPALANWRVHALAVRRYPRVPVFHGFLMHLINAPEKLLFFNAPILVHRVRRVRLTLRRASPCFHGAAASRQLPSVGRFRAGGGFPADQSGCVLIHRYAQRRDGIFQPGYIPLNVSSWRQSRRCRVRACRPVDFRSFRPPFWPPYRPVFQIRNCCSNLTLWFLSL